MACFTSGRKLEGHVIYSPAFDSELRSTSMAQAGFALVNTIIGGGLLTLPLAFSYLGIYAGSILLILVGYINDYTILLLVKSSRRSGLRSYEDLMKFAFGPIGQVILLLMVLGIVFLAPIAFAILMRDLAAPVIETYMLNGESLSLIAKNVFMVTLCWLTSHLTLMKSMGAIAKFMGISMLAMITLIVIIVYRSIESMDLEFNGEYLYWPVDTTVALKALPIIMCSYTCHFNVNTLYGELKRPTMNRANFWVHSSVGFSCFLYLAISLFGYIFAMRFSGYTEDNILNNFSVNDPLVNVARCALFVVLIFAYSLTIVPCRKNILELFCMCCAVRDVKLDIADEEKQTPLLQADGTLEIGKERPVDVLLGNPVVKVFCTYAIIAVTTSLAIILGTVGPVWAVMGSLVCFSVCFTFPPLIFIQVHKNDPDYRGTVVFCWLIAIVASMLTVVCTVQSIYDILGSP